MDEKFQSELLLIYKRPRHEILLTNVIPSKLSENVNKMMKGVEQDEIFQKYRQNTGCLMECITN